MFHMFHMFHMFITIPPPVSGFTPHIVHKHAAHPKLTPLFLVPCTNRTSGPGSSRIRISLYRGRCETLKAGVHSHLSAKFMNAFFRSRRQLLPTLMDARIRRQAGSDQDTQYHHYESQISYLGASFRRPSSTSM